MDIGKEEQELVVPKQGRWQARISPGSSLAFHTSSFYLLSDYSTTLKMEPAGYLKYAVPYYWTIWCHNPEDHNLNIHCCENLKSHTFHWYLNSDNDMSNAEWNGTFYHHQWRVRSLPCKIWNINFHKWKYLVDTFVTSVLLLVKVHPIHFLGNFKIKHLHLTPYHNNLQIWHFKIITKLWLFNFNFNFLYITVT